MRQSISRTEIYNSCKKVADCMRLSNCKELVNYHNIFARLVLNKSRDICIDIRYINNKLYAATTDCKYPYWRRLDINGYYDIVENVLSTDNNFKKILIYMSNKMIAEMYKFTKYIVSSFDIRKYPPLIAFTDKIISFGDFNIIDTRDHNSYLKYPILCNISLSWEGLSSKYHNSILKLFNFDNEFINDEIAKFDSDTKQPDTLKISLIESYLNEIELFKYSKAVSVFSKMNILKFAKKLYNKVTKETNEDDSSKYSEEIDNVCKDIINNYIQLINYINDKSKGCGNI